MMAHRWYYINTDYIPWTPSSKVDNAFKDNFEDRFYFWWVWTKSRCAWYLTETETIFKACLRKPSLPFWPASRSIKAICHKLCHPCCAAVDQVLFLYPMRFSNSRAVRIRIYRMYSAYLLFISLRRSAPTRNGANQPTTTNKPRMLLINGDDTVVFQWRTDLTNLDRWARVCFCWRRLTDTDGPVTVRLPHFPSYDLHNMRKTGIKHTNFT